MPILISCPVSGAVTLVPSFGSGTTRITAPHPLLTCTIAQLVRVQDISSAQDSHILLCAWLEQLSQIKIAAWAGKLTPENFSSRWHEQQLDHIINMVQWLVHNANHPALDVVPHIRITPELNGENLQTWRESCQSIVASYTTYFDIAETLRIRENLVRAERALEAGNSGTTTKVSIAARKQHSRKAYLLTSLGLHENQQAVELVIKVCTMPQAYEVQTIQKVKEFCLDYLPENGIENYNDKQEVIQILDAAMLDKLGMASILGIGNSAEHTQISAELTTKYTIMIDGKSYGNGAFPSISKSVASLNAGNAANLGSAEQKTYETEPLREQFKSLLGYSIAHKQWSAQQK